MHHLNIAAITGRGLLVLISVCLLSLSAMGAVNVPVATRVSADTSGSSTRITIYGTAPLPYSVSRPDSRTIVVELPGVDASRLDPSYRFASPLVTAVAVEHELRADRTPDARLRIGLLAPVRDRSQLSDNSLVLELTPAGPAAGLPGGRTGADTAQTTRPAPSPTPLPVRPMQPGVSISPAAPGNPPQSSQGQQYGQPGFVGEPINLNVVNADIRDILNYITEQYGVNFVIDSSVGPVPVTVNVSDVPWNVALDAILRANRLGIDVNGNILRVATTEVLANEASVQQKVSDARLNNAPLLTEFIRLNYARASGTLAQTAGATGGFSGGVASGATAGTSLSGTGASAGAGGVGDQGILPIVQRRLSRRGSVEIDGRSNTLIITDVRENIDAIRQLVTLLDQPEPQVEIETRIVIATRSFSRDLGVQLNALAINTHTGGNIGFNTAAGSPVVGGTGATDTIGLRPSGIPQGILNPSGALGANLPNTVIGLTTGLIGTAQISALITAAENKGQAKTVASPRVTALNNRPAQIESGQQIPVVTAQAGTTGNALVFTTTFVSAPLRLSVTPQITDVGTVILRVVAENNTVRRDLAVNGTPGIDTQRMQSEVLVPDGGTTVIGGVLADAETELQTRTPGVASVPVLGNLFKRKSTQRETSEILFFITPRIYRPDYQGRPTSGTVSTGTRTTTIAQPVPMGNPPTNTPAPSSQSGQQQQQQSPLNNTPETQTTAPTSITPAPPRP